MSNPLDLVRQAFIRSMEIQQSSFKMPSNVQHKDIFERNLESAQRCVAYDAAVEAAARALKTQDLTKVRALLRRAHVVYTPASTVVHVYEDGHVTVTTPATAEILG